MFRRQIFQAISPTIILILRSYIFWWCSRLISIWLDMGHCFKVTWSMPPVWADFSVQHRMAPRQLCRLNFHGWERAWVFHCSTNPHTPYAGWWEDRLTLGAGEWCGTVWISVNLPSVVRCTLRRTEDQNHCHGVSANPRWQLLTVTFSFSLASVPFQSLTYFPLF